MSCSKDRRLCLGTSELQLLNTNPTVKIRANMRISRVLNRTHIPNTTPDQLTVEQLLFCSEAKLINSIKGTTAFADEFIARGIR